METKETSEVRVPISSITQEVTLSTTSQVTTSTFELTKPKKPTSETEEPASTNNPPKTSQADDANKVYEPASTNNSGKKWRVFFWIELTSFVCLAGLLVASLTVEKLQNHKVWDLEIWNWCVLTLSILCGRLVTEWFVEFLVLLIERSLLLKEKVFYYVYGLQKSVQVFVWLGLVLLAWVLLFTRGFKRSKNTTKTLDYITKAIVSCLVGAAMWLVKTFLIKLLASHFHVKQFFKKIQQFLFQQQVLQALSVRNARVSGILSFKDINYTNEGEKETVIHVDRLQKVNKSKVSGWTMTGLIDAIHSTKLPTLSNVLEECNDEDQLEMEEKVIEQEARAVADRIFNNLGAKPEDKYINQANLLHFLRKEDLEKVTSQFPQSTVEEEEEVGKIRKSVFRNWVVSVYRDRYKLVRSLKDSDTAIEDLNIVASGIVLIIIIIVALLIMGLLTTQVLVFLSSQFLLVAFMFGNTTKTVFEAIIFVFMAHPFDCGDRCVVDGVQMIVQEVNILNTVFLRYDGEKIYYPNAILATKPISNFNRSPEMGDSVEFAISFSTTTDTINSLKAQIEEYLKKNSKHWCADHSLVVKEIEDMNKMKMALYVKHTINFQDCGKRNKRRTELVLELKRIFEELKIRYHLLPQEVQLRYL